MSYPHNSTSAYEDPFQDGMSPPLRAPDESRYEGSAGGRSSPLGREEGTELAPLDTYGRTAREASPDGRQRYTLSDTPYIGHPSSGTIPTGSTYSLAGSGLGGDSYAGEDQYRENQEEEDEVRPLREEFTGGFYRPEETLEPVSGFVTDPNSFPVPRTYGQGGLSRRQTSAEAWQQRQRINPQRAKTKKVKLTPQGNFITEYPVPTAVKNANLSLGADGGPTEFTHMRYTAACCDPNDFTKENGYTLRASSYGRETDLLVCITAYNENKVLLSRTLHGLMVNIRDMVKGKFSEFRRKFEAGGHEAGRFGEAWKRIVVCLVFDGIAPADKAALDVLATIGLYQDGVMKKDVDGKETVAHIFEVTTGLSMSPKLALVEPAPNDSNNLVPVQMIFVLKQKNAKKINSHRWLFNAVGRHLNPDVVCLLDAGTKPGKRSIYYLWEAFHHNKYLGGACGEIHAMLGKNSRKLLNPLIAAQNFEYKMSNILDKPTESSFGYVSVLPGAFSCYRYVAIQGRPLSQYFHGDHTHTLNGTKTMTLWEKNMFLAEDRILCFELVAKANERWVLGYIKPAKGETDVPETAAELISQRRRWLNGSFAAGVYSLAHLPRLYRSDHGIIRLFFLHVQAIYNTINLVMSTVALANYFLTFEIIISIVASSLRHPFSIGGLSDPATATQNCWAGSFLEDPDRTSTSDFWLTDVNWVFKVIYLIFLGLQVILALGNRPKAERRTYAISIAVYAFFSFYLIFMTVILTIKAFCPIKSILKASGGSAISVFLGSTFGPIFAGILGTFGVYILGSIIYLDPWHLITSMPPFLLIAPSFTNILNIYAFCNLHDVSWGTKGSDKVDSLPSATSKTDGKEQMVEIQEKIQEDIDLTFTATVQRAIAPFDETEEVEPPSLDDQNKTFRTRFICVWLLINALLALAISKLTSVQASYFQAILWITFGLSAVRFTGLVWYLFGESVFRLARLCGRRN